MALQQSFILLLAVFVAQPIGGATQEKVGQKKRPDQILQEVLNSFGLQEKVRLVSAANRHAHGKGVQVFRLDFHKKEGFQFRDLFRITSKVQDALPDARIISFDAGYSGPGHGPPGSRIILRPLLMEVAIPPKSGWTAKSPGKARIPGLLAFLEIVNPMWIRGQFAQFKKLRVDASAIATDFRVSGVKELDLLLDHLHGLPRFSLFALDRIAESPGVRGISCGGRILFK